MGGAKGERPRRMNERVGEEEQVRGSGQNGVKFKDCRQIDTVWDLGRHFELYAVISEH